MRTRPGPPRRSCYQCSPRSYSWRGQPAGRGGGRGSRRRLIVQPGFEFRQALQLLVAPAALVAVDARRLKHLAGGATALLLLAAAVAVLLGQVFVAAEGIGLQLGGDAVAPAGGDLVDG